MGKIILSNDDLYRYFKCANQGGMRYSSDTDTLLLIIKTNKDKSSGSLCYNDEWDEKHSGIRFIGEGTDGDQQLTRQNKRLSEYSVNTTRVLLFEQNAPNAYIFHGEVIPDGEVEEDRQEDSNGEMRRVYIFPLKIVSDREQDISIIKGKKIRNLSLYYLNKRANKEFNLLEFGKKKTCSTKFARSPYVAELARRFANGICQLCKKDAPFISKDNQPFLEVHHLKWLAKGGKDCIKNVVAVCPNCHRKLHNLMDPKDIEVCKKAIDCMVSFLAEQTQKD